MSEKRISGMVWRRKLALYLTPPLMLALGVWLLVSHANTQLWSLEGVVLVLAAHALASVAQLQAAANKLSGDVRNVLRMLALACLVAGFLIVYYGLLGHLPSLG